MKNLILSLSFLTSFSSLAFGQQKPIIANINNTMRTETYSSFEYQTDSIRFTIVSQNDTVLTEKFYANGQLEKQIWRKDSVYTFDRLGRLDGKDYLPKGEKHQKKTQISYYSNQKIKEIRTWQNDDMGFCVYDVSGALELHAEKKQVAPSRFYTICYDGQNRKRLSRQEIRGYVYRNDSTTLFLDTIFYETGRIKKMQTEVNRNVLTFAEYTPNGQQIAPLFPDSLRLFPFKDNYNCYYGLKNRRDDTLFSPRFDNVLTLNHEDLFAIQIGDRVQLWRQDGKQLSTNSMTGLRNLNTAYYNSNIINFRSLIFDINEHNWESDLTTDKRNNTFFNFKSETGNGIINAEGKIVIPPQYPPFYDKDNLNKYFAFSKVPHTYGTRLSKVIDLSGKILFNDRYPYIEISPIQGYFYTANQENIEDELRFACKGLVDSVGTEILPNLYKNIEPFGGNLPNLVWVDLGKEQLNSENKKEFVTERSGIFNIKTRLWQIPLNIYMDNRYGRSTGNFISVALQVDTKKYGLVGKNGDIILPFVYDSLYLSENKNYYILIKNGNYQFYSVEKKKFSSNYAFLWHIDFDEYSHLREPYPIYFAAKRGDKWGVIDTNETVILPFEYDYATTNEKRISENNLILVKNNRLNERKLN